jgi:hypothetical protein
LAVKTAEDIMTTRAIRALLMKGADCNIRDEKGDLPEDFIDDYDKGDALTMELAKEVFELVHEAPDSCFSKYNPLKGCECFAIK